ncbi:hypothetical protein UlMin_016650 [Ulmus minor]
MSCNKSHQSSYIPSNLESTKCKIRKRNCSSSSSSSLVRKYRFKRVILMGKRGGSSTPAPMWDTSVRSPSSSAAINATPNNNSECSKLKQQSEEKAKQVSVLSARKLAATLWEINQVGSKNKDLKDRPEKFPKQPSPLPDPSLAPISNRMQRRDEHGGVGHHRTKPAVTEKLQLTNYHHLGASNSLSLIEVEDHFRSKNCNGNFTSGAKNRLKEVNNGLATSKELLNLLSHVWCLEKQSSLSKSLFSAIRFELDRACIHVEHLIRVKRSDKSEIEHLMKHFAEEKAARKSKERERIHRAVSSIAEELKAEKKLRRQTERLNKKIGEELADTKLKLSNVANELEREKRAKEILEQVCDELDKGIVEDRAHVEELKKESAKVLQEVEKERQMLQLADVLREERVQMKLLEAKYQFEEKNEAVEQLRNELEAYLRSKLGREDGETSPKFEKIKELEAYLKKINFGSARNGGEEEEQDEGDDSGDSDLQSIELNMDNNSRSYKWSFTCGDDEDDSKRISVDREFKGRKSISEKIQWASICLNKNPNGIDLEFGNKSLGSSQAQNPSFTSPARHWDQALVFEDHGNNESQRIQFEAKS